MQRGYGALKKIYSIRNALDRKTKTLLSESLVLSRLNFCNAVYGPCLDYRDKRRTQGLQNSCMRLIFGVRGRGHISHRARELGWLSMENRRKMHSTALFFNIVKTKQPSYLYNKISFRTDVHNLNLRYRGGLTPPLHTSEFFKRGFAYCVAKTINTIPPCLRSLSVATMKRELLKDLLSQQ